MSTEWDGETFKSKKKKKRFQSTTKQDSMTKLDSKFS